MNPPYLGSKIELYAFRDYPARFCRLERDAFPRIGITLCWRFFSTAALRFDMPCPRLDCTRSADCGPAGALVLRRLLRFTSGRALDSRFEVARRFRLPCWGCTYWNSSSISMTNSSG